MSSVTRSIFTPKLHPRNFKMLAIFGVANQDYLPGHRGIQPVRNQRPDDCIGRAAFYRDRLGKGANR